MTYRTYYSTRNNMPKILTCISCAGVIGTAVCAIVESDDIKKAVAETKDEPFFEKVKAVAKAGKKTLIFAGASIGCGIGAQKVNGVTIASLAAAGAALTSQKNELQKVVKNVVGEEKANEIFSEIDKKSDEVKKELLGEKSKKEIESDLRNYRMVLFEDCPPVDIVCTEAEMLSAQFSTQELLSKRGYATINDFLGFFPAKRKVEKLEVRGNSFGWRTDDEWFESNSYGWIEWREYVRKDKGVTYYDVDTPYGPVFIADEANYEAMVLSPFGD